MEQFYILDKLEVKIEMETVFHLIDCHKDSPVYDTMVEEYQSIIDEVKSLAKPVGVFGFATLTEETAAKEYPAGTKVIYSVVSVGNEISRCSTKAFSEGEYVRGMLYDAMADSALFSLESGLMESLKTACKEHGTGIKKRLEAPQDIPMTVQRVAWDVLKLKERFGIDITSGYMFDPVKTSCQVFVLTEEENCFKAEHDCSNCTNLNCKLRNIPGIDITVKKGNETTCFKLEANESLMDGLIRAGYYINAVCGGKGRCGKCKIKVLSGNAPVSSEDDKFFSEKELSEGYRLSCTLYPKEALMVSFEEIDESEFEVVSAYKDDLINSTNHDLKYKAGKTSEIDFTAGFEKYSEDKLKNVTQNNSNEIVIPENVTSEGEISENTSNSSPDYKIAIDIGTTTIALQLLEKNSGKICNTITKINTQRKYGADVISRIQASVDGKKEALRECIQQDLRDGIIALCGSDKRACFLGADSNYKKSGTSYNIPFEQITEIGISCNTTMGHLLLGYDCKGLGLYPFTPVNIDFVTGDMEEILGMEGSAKVTILPGISTYVGGDIVSGLYSCEFDKTEEINLLIDLGTNGEMALGNSKKILVASTAAGPAFEGGNISCGMGSVAGAICSVKIKDGKADIKTIQNKAPIGICGTGVVETVSELLKTELMDETGLLDEDYFDDGFCLAHAENGKTIAFTQKDIRELQLAKSAIRAGIETLLLKYGIKKEQVSKVYLAGGFGYKLPPEKAIHIGMLPEEFEGKIYAIGNSSLAGVVKYMCDENADNILQELVNNSTEIGLSVDKDFNEFYMKHMMFEG